MNVSLSKTFEQYIERQVGSGRYNNASEVIREALRLKMQSDEIYQTKLQALREDVDQACKQVEKGEFVSFDPLSILAKAKGDDNR